MRSAQESTSVGFDVNVAMISTWTIRIGVVSPAANLERLLKRMEPS